MSVSDTQDEVEISTLDAATNTAVAGSAVDEMMVEDKGGDGALDFSSLVPLCLARKAFISHQVPVWDSLVPVVGIRLRIGNTQPARLACVKFFSFFFLRGHYSSTVVHSPL